MQIQSGKLFENRTLYYLYPCLKDYGSNFISKLNSVFKLAVGIRDNYHNNKIKSLYLLISHNYGNSNISSTTYRKSFKNFLNYIREHSSYITDYPVNFNESHMIVIKFPEKYYIAYDNFLLGKYSKMYDKSQIDFIYPIQGISEKTLKRNLLSRAVINKNRTGLEHYKKVIKEEFNVILQDSDCMDNREFDIPYNKKEEIFNF